MDGKGSWEGGTVCSSASSTENEREGEGKAKGNLRTVCYLLFVSWLTVGKD